MSTTTTTERVAYLDAVSKRAVLAAQSALDSGGKDGTRGALALLQLENLDAADLEFVAARIAGELARWMTAMNAIACPGCGTSRIRTQNEEHGALWLCLNQECTYDK